MYTANQEAFVGMAGKCTPRYIEKNRKCRMKKEIGKNKTLRDNVRHCLVYIVEKECLRT